MPTLDDLRRRIACLFGHHDFQQVGSIEPTGYVTAGWLLTFEPEYRTVSRCARCDKERREYWIVPELSFNPVKRDDRGWPVDANGQRLPVCMERSDYK